jgi:hypothetical protein
MCKRKDSIRAQNAAAERLRKVCVARRTYVEVRADLLRDRSTLKLLPSPPDDFAVLTDKLNKLN